MLPSQIANQTVTRLRGTPTTDAHGNTYVSWTSPSSTTLVGVSVQGSLGQEDVDGRAAVVWSFKLFAQPDHDVTAHDRILTEDGRTFEVDGPVVPMPDPTGNGLDHKMSKLRLVEG